MTRHGFTEWCKKYLKNAKLRQVIQEEKNEMDSWGDVSHIRTMDKNSGAFGKKPLIDA